MLLMISIGRHRVPAVQELEDFCLIKGRIQQRLLVGTPKIFRADEVHFLQVILKRVVTTLASLLEAKAISMALHKSHLQQTECILVQVQIQDTV